MSLVGQAVKKAAVVLLSGGIDSVTAMEIAKKQGFEVHTLSFSYGQRHSFELTAIQKILEKYPPKSHQLVEIDLRAFGGSALTDQISVPKTKEFKGMSHQIPVTYVPARNTIFLSFALGFAETLSVFDIFFGMNQLDAMNYPDCRPEYVHAFEHLANLATAAGTEQQRKGQFRIHTPLAQMNKAQVIRTGLDLGIDYSITTSCYDPSPEGAACGQCDACHLRRNGFEMNGVADPILYK